MELDIEKELLDAVSHPLVPGLCFLCGELLDGSNTSREDVIPLWLQRDLQLGDKHLTLINGTQIPYQQLTIPCCIECNTQHLSRMENTVSDALRNGVSAVRELPECLIYQWLAKLYIGLLYRELTLPFDRSSPKNGTITCSADLANVRILWFWLKQEMLMKKESTPPGSLWVFDCLVPPEGRGERFDLHTFHSPPTLGIRINNVGMVVDFLDCGLLRRELHLMEQDFIRLRLSPLQFIEVFVRISYKAHLFGLYTTVGACHSADGEDALVFVPKSTVSGDNAFRPWNEAKYTDFLASRMNETVESILESNGIARSWIYTENNHIMQFSYTDSGLH